MCGKLALLHGEKFLINLGRIKVNLTSCVDGTLRMCADVPECHKPTTTATANEQRMTFRMKKCGKVEAESTSNPWAAQCQSKVRFFFILSKQRFFLILGG